MFGNKKIGFFAGLILLVSVSQNIFGCPAVSDMNNTSPEEINRSVTFNINTITSNGYSNINVNKWDFTGVVGNGTIAAKGTPISNGSTGQHLQRKGIILQQ